MTEAIKEKIGMKKETSFESFQSKLLSNLDKSGKFGHYANKLAAEINQENYRNIVSQYDSFRKSSKKGVDLWNKGIEEGNFSCVKNGLKTILGVDYNNLLKSAEKIGNIFWDFNNAQPGGIYKEKSYRDDDKDLGSYFSTIVMNTIGEEDSVKSLKVSGNYWGKRKSKEKVIAGNVQKEAESVKLNLLLRSRLMLVFDRLTYQMENLGRFEILNSLAGSFLRLEEIKKEIIEETSEMNRKNFGETISNYIFQDVFELALSVTKNRKAILSGSASKSPDYMECAEYEKNISNESFFNGSYEKCKKQAKSNSLLIKGGDEKTLAERIKGKIISLDFELKN